jgi:hypothetical protein
MHERWQGLARIKQEVHRAAREGTVNSDQLWGLNSQACCVILTADSNAGLARLQRGRLTTQY